MADFHFGQLQTEKESRLLKAFILSQPFNYPYYEDWTTRCISEIEGNYKKAMLAFYRDNKTGPWTLVGDSIYQEAKESELPNTMHFKNMRVAKELRRGGVASFLTKRVEVEARKRGLFYVILDFRAEQRGILRFFLRQGYKPLFQESLYDSNHSDIIMLKDLTQKESFLTAELH